jgi:hypothetical protein
MPAVPQGASPGGEIDEGGFARSAAFGIMFFDK